MAKHGRDYIRAISIAIQHATWYRRIDNWTIAFYGGDPPELKDVSVIDTETGEQVIVDGNDEDWQADQESEG
jgi:hypothetical protein